MRSVLTLHERQNIIWLSNEVLFEKMKLEYRNTLTILRIISLGFFSGKCVMIGIEKGSKKDYALNDKYNKFLWNNLTKLLTPFT